MRRLHFRLATADGRTLNTTPANDPPVIVEPRTPPPEPGAVLTDPSDSARYLLMDVEAEISRGITRYYRLGLQELRHTITVQRLGSSRNTPEITTIATEVPAHLHGSSLSDSDGPDRSRPSFRLEVWTPPIPAIQKNDRVILGGQAYRVIDMEHLPHISRIIATDDYR